MKTINYTGSSKMISRIVNLLNRKAPLPLDGDGDPDWGTNGQVLSTDGSGGTAWVNQGGGGDSVSWTQDVTTGTKIAEIDINGTTTDVYAPSGGSGGHTIWNRIKSALMQRGKLWFADASVSDASADDATKVEVVTELLNETAFDNLATDGTADGIYTFPDSGSQYLTADMVGYDNTASGLYATDVQDAIDELAQIGSRTVTTLVNESVSLAAGGSKNYATLTSTYLSQFDEVSFLCNWTSSVATLVVTKAQLAKVQTVYGNAGALCLTCGSKTAYISFGSSGTTINNGANNGTMGYLLIEGITY